MNPDPSQPPACCPACLCDEIAHDQKNYIGFMCGSAAQTKLNGKGKATREWEFINNGQFHCRRAFTAAIALRPQLAALTAERDYHQDDAQKWATLAHKAANERDEARAQVAELQARCNQAIPILTLYAIDNPKWFDHERGEQDPSGVHALLARLSESERKK